MMNKTKAFVDVSIGFLSAISISMSKFLQFKFGKIDDLCEEEIEGLEK